MLLIAAHPPAWSGSERLAPSVRRASESVERLDAAAFDPLKVSPGFYTVLAIIPAAQPANSAKLQLVPISQPRDSGAFSVLLPQTALEQGKVAVGQLVKVTRREYGISLGVAETGRPFFLLLDDAPFAELKFHLLPLR